MDYAENMPSTLDPSSLGHAEDVDFHEPLGVFPPETETSLLTRLRRHKLLFATTFLSVAGAVVCAYLYVPAVYRTQAAVTVEAPDRVLASQQAPGSELTVGDGADLESQSIVLSSPTAIRQLLQQPAIQAALLRECEAMAPPAWKVRVHQLLQMTPTPPCSEQLQDSTGMVASVKARLAVATNGRSRVIDVAFSSPLPDVAQLVANGVVQNYLDGQTEAKVRPADQAIDWLRSESVRVADRLKLTETQIDKFLHERGVIRGQTAPIASEQLTSLSQQLALAEADRAAAAGRQQQSRSQGAATSGVLDSRSVSDIKLQLATVTSQIALMSSRYGSANPALAELQDQRRGLERMLSQETSLVTRSATADFQAANSRVAALSQQVDALKQNVRGNDDATTQVASLQRDAATDHELFVDLTKNLNQLETNRRLITANARLVSWAEMPQAVFFPKRSTFALTGLLLSTALAVVVTLLRDRADRTLRAVDQVQAAGMRVLARIPYVSRMGRSASRLGKRLDRPSSLQESIRGLYAECMLVKSRFHGNVKPLRSIMVASADSGEGKSFITLALAHFASAAGQRVLVIECDLRQPGMGRTLSMPPQPGLSEFLRGEITAEQAVSASSSGGLDVILAGRPAVDSAELLGSPRMRQLIAWATARYDLTLTDTPSARAVPDARVLAPNVDGILYCARWGHSHQSTMMAGVAAMRAAGGRVLGLVLDRVEQEHYRLYEPGSLPAGSYSVARYR
jgi:succinoglycan biosynthesis transport protein ExoP